MAAPTLPTWATTGGTTTEPSSGKKAAGWVKGERPPAKFLNWIFNTIYLWIVHLYAGNHGSLSKTFTPTAHFTAGTYTVAVDGSAESTGADLACIPLNGFRVGDRIVSIAIRHKRTGGAVNVEYIFQPYVDGVTGSSTTTGAVAAPAATGSQAVSSINYTVLTNAVLTLTINPAGAGVKVYSIMVTYDRLG